MVGPDRKLTCPSTAVLEGAERDRKWLVALGIISLILGLLALTVPVATTFASIFFLGSLLLISGIFQFFRNFRVREGKELVLHMVIAVLYVAVGAIMLFNPGISAASLSLLLASFFIVGGILRIARSAAGRFHNWGWVFFNGLVALALGVIIFAGWPVTALWVIGLFIAIEMIFYGISMLMLASAGREELREIREYCEVPV